MVWRYKTVNLLTNAHCQFLGSLAKFISGVVTDTLVVGEKHRYKQLFAMAQSLRPHWCDQSVRPFCHVTGLIVLVHGALTPIYKLLLGARPPPQCFSHKETEAQRCL